MKLTKFFAREAEKLGVSLESVDDGEQFVIFDRVIGNIDELYVEENALAQLLYKIANEIALRIEENKEVE